jgi:hypothetical protein
MVSHAPGRPMLIEAPDRERFRRPNGRRIRFRYRMPIAHPHRRRDELTLQRSVLRLKLTRHGGYASI